MACVGMDAVTGVTRFSFGSATLKYGIDMLPAMIALIALTQVVQKLRDFKVSGGKLDDARKIDKQGITKKEMISILPACLRSSAIASVLGAMPGGRRRCGTVPLLQRSPPHFQAPRRVRQRLPGGHRCRRIFQQRGRWFRYDPSADAGHPR